MLRHLWHALDQINNKLYVATPDSITIYVYALNADGNPFSISPASTISTTYYAISVAVDEGNQYLYYGGGFYGNYNLSQYNLGTSGESHYYIASGEGVMGLDVDQDNHNVYISTGTSGDNLRVFDSSLNLLSTKSTEVARPTGLVIPRGQISYNPLDLSKDDGLAEDECVNANEDITYQICYNNSLNEFDVHNVTINDTLPANTTFVSASDGGTYDAENRIVTWNIGTVMAGSPEACVTLVVRVNASAETRVSNSVTINSDETPQTTQSEDTTVCASQPSGESTDSSGWTKDRYTTEEDVYATGGGFNPQITDMNIYVFGDKAWTDGDDTTGYTGYASLTNVPVTGGNVGPVIIWEKKDTKIGEYDIFFDANKNRIYDVGIDAVDDPNHPGFTISGERQEVPALTPFGLLALVGLLSGIAVLTIRKRRG